MRQSAQEKLFEGGQFIPARSGQFPPAGWSIYTGFRVVNQNWPEGVTLSVFSMEYQDDGFWKLI